MVAPGRGGTGTEVLGQRKSDDEADVSKLKVRRRIAPAILSSEPAFGGERDHTWLIC
jgi:hypothetical protein